jgi:hypothetical protein
MIAIDNGDIRLVSGTAIARSLDGVQRILMDGDPVFQGEEITLNGLGAAQVQYDNGSLVAITDDVEAIEEEVTAIQDALLDGADPTAEAEPTAAGADALAGNEGVDVVQVSHLAPQATPTSGFDTTGIANDFADREFQVGLLTQEDDGIFGSTTPTPPEPSNTTPVADAVATRSNLTSDTLPGDFPVTNPVYFKTFDIGGGLDGDLSIVENGLVDPADLGGFDAETTEASLSFKVESLPNYGDLYVFDGSSYTKIDAININTVTFSTTDSLYWAATQSQVLAVTGSGDSHTVSFLNGLDIGAANAEGLSLSGFDLNGDAASIRAFRNDGLGIDTRTDRIGQLEFNDGQSESIVFDFAKDAINAEISVTHLIANEAAGEIGVVTAFLDGNEIGQWTFTAGAMATADFSPLNGNVDVSSVGPGNGAGSVTFTLGETIFDQLTFTAVETQNPGDARDASDYFVAEIAYDDLGETPDATYSYSTTDEDTNVSTPAQVVIEVTEPTLLGSSDTFTWTPADLPVSGTGHDVVSSFDVSEGDTLDLSDLLQDNGVSNQIDGLAVGDAGSEHLQINIRDTAGNIVQELELVDVAVFNSIAAQTTLVQLIDNGHVIVD